MTYVKILWTVNFFAFAFALIFVWSKIYIISRKIQTVASSLETIDSLDDDLEGKPHSGPAADKPQKT